MTKYHFIIDEQTGRIDKVLQECLEMSRSQIQVLLKKEYVQVNEVIVKANYKVKCRDKIDVTIPEKEELDVIPENLPLDIIFEDEDIVIVNKVSGMVVHPSVNHETGTLVNALLYHIKDLSSGTGEVRPGIVHRIDKDTSGLLVVAKHNKAHQLLSEQLQQHSMTREYIALVHGVIEEDNGTIHAPLARDKYDRLKWSVQKEGKDAITHFTVLQRYAHHTLVSLRLETGRTHQIRVHMQFIGHELVGDLVYSHHADDKSMGQYLHAKTLGFIHPRTQQNVLFTSELPHYFKEYLDNLVDA
ncbi:MULTISPECIES: RluA family pseudouridine synthase [unclassified Granulicatella]|uniref:RluA family pseudouridine synthase n=1 Tax=unclassified Granulicatella TaxID=2630493 RepID=UPI0010735BEE|nr:MULTISPECIES: RluA family pseudouridine synthase [unclassified Granulicatella]MBF0779701.1 RluA family pseudouridine synthase [Granulicatella sp. 19428wC4_WM01]TFU96223.1 RluA family pseudouridine synthase [Granulicatella sp. WM01]